MALKKLVLIDEDNYNRQLFLSVVDEIRPKVKCVAFDPKDFKLQQLDKLQPTLLFIAWDILDEGSRGLIRTWINAAATSRIPVIMLTKYMSDKDQFYRDGLTILMEKPASYGTLKVELVKIILQNS